MDANGREHRTSRRSPFLREVTSRRHRRSPRTSADTGETDGERLRFTFAYAVETTEGGSGVQVRTRDVKWLLNWSRLSATRV